MTSSPTPSHERREPLRNRSATSVRGWTFTSPRTPCGAPTTPTMGSVPPAAVPDSLVRARPPAPARRPRSSVDFEVDLCSIARRHHLEERADSLGDPPTTADHLSDVRLGDLEVELCEISVELLGDDYGRRIVDKRLSDVLEEHAHPSRLRPNTHLTGSISRLRRGDAPTAVWIRSSRRSRSSLI